MGGEPRVARDGGLTMATVVTVQIPVGLTPARTEALTGLERAVWKAVW